MVVKRGNFSEEEKKKNYKKNDVHAGSCRLFFLLLFFKKKNETVSRFVETQPAVFPIDCPLEKDEIVETQTHTQLPHKTKKKKATLLKKWPKTFFFDKNRCGTRASTTEFDILYSLCAFLMIFDHQTVLC